MGGLRNIFFVILLSQYANSMVEVTEEFSWYRQIGLNLTDSFIADGKEIPNDLREWPLIKKEILTAGKSGLFFMKKTNRLALVPEFPVISCFNQTYAKKHNGSKIIAVSRTALIDGNRIGRYAILQTSDLESVWATWLAEDDAQILFKSLGDFEPSKEPLPFPEVEDRENSERLAAESEEKAIRQIVKEKDLRESSRKPTSGEREKRKIPNSSGEVKSGRDKFNSFIWLILSVFLAISLLSIWRITKKHSSP